LFSSFSADPIHRGGLSCVVCRIVGAKFISTASNWAGKLTLLNGGTLPSLAFVRFCLGRDADAVRSRLRVKGNSGFRNGGSMTAPGSEQSEKGFIDLGRKYFFGGNEPPIN